MFDVAVTAQGETRLFAPSYELDPNDMWVYLPHDFELRDLVGYSVWTGEDYNRDGRTRWYPRQHGDPETVVTFYKEDRVYLTPAWRDFNKKLFTLAAFGEANLNLFPMIETKFNSAMADNRVITNNQIWYEGYMPLLMGGNIVRLIDNVIRRPNSLFGLARKIETLNASMPPPDVEEVFWTKPWLWSKATIARYAFPDDNIGLANPWSHVIPFPQLDVWNAHVPLLNISNDGYNYVQIARSVPWYGGYAPNPYNPPLIKKAP